jgi:ABC-type glycerol-3-phosphate transport system substrate-binding protein
VRRAVVLGLMALAALAACTPKPGTVTKSYVAACAADTAAIRGAEETYRAASPSGDYATLDQLVPGFLRDRPKLHTVTDVAAGSYKVRVTDKRCGAASSADDANVVDGAHPANH